MQTHYRKLASSELAALVVDMGTTEYGALASFHAVRVGSAGDGSLLSSTPWLGLLLDGGIETVEEARSTDLTTITGIGEARAAEILASLPEPGIVVHVTGPDAEGLPGTLLGETLEALDEGTRTGMTPHEFA